MIETDEFTNVFKAIAIRAASAVPVSEDDYTDETGLLICGKCRTPKQCRPFPDCDAAVFCLCKCMADADNEMAERRHQEQIAQRRTFCFGGSDLSGASFAADDGRNPELTACCRSFAERITAKGNDWLLLWGGCGTGKSYMAACIANAALCADMTARFVTVPEVEQMLWRERDKAAVYDEMQSVGLLVIDDFGCERKTEYMDEIKFNLIDGRLRSGKPCVLTTNLTMNDFSAPKDLAMKRIVSRLFERLTTFQVQGEDRRFAALRERAGRIISR